MTGSFLLASHGDARLQRSSQIVKPKVLQFLADVLAKSLRIARTSGRWSREVTFGDGDTIASEQSEHNRSSVEQVTEKKTTAGHFLFAASGGGKATFSAFLFV